MWVLNSPFSYSKSIINLRSFFSQKTKLMFESIVIEKVVYSNKIHKKYEISILKKIISDKVCTTQDSPE